MPLLTILEPERTNDFIRTFLDMNLRGGRLPIWEIQGTLSAHMIGRHALPVLLDAYRKGIRNYDVNLAYKAMVASIESDIAFNDLYKNYGFIPVDREGVWGNVSILMEIAYNNWCVAVMAKMLDREEDEMLYQYRS